MYPFDRPKPLSDESISVLIDLAVLHFFLVNHPGPNQELVIWSSHLAFLLYPDFPPLLHLQRIPRLLSVYCPGDMPLAIGSGISTFLCKIIEPTPSHIDTLFSSSSSFVGKQLCGAAFFMPACTRELYVRDDTI